MNSLYKKEVVFFLWGKNWIYHLINKVNQMIYGKTAINSTNLNVSFQLLHNKQHQGKKVKQSL
jgi:hypothetical protein